MNLPYSQRDMDLQSIDYRISTERKSIYAAIENYQGYILRGEMRIRELETLQNAIYIAAMHPLADEWRLTRLVENLLVEADMYKECNLPFFADKAALGAFKNPNCPVELISRACRCPNPYYRKYASGSPRCPEADRVWAALMGTGER